MADFLGRLGGLLGPQGLGTDDQRRLGQQSLLAAGLGILANGGPNAFQSIGRGLLSGMQVGSQAGDAMLARSREQEELDRQRKLRELLGGESSPFEGTLRAIAALDPAVAAKLQDPGDLVAVVGEDGKPRYERRSKAVGQEAYQKQINTAEAPASIQEYNLYSQQATAAGQRPMPFEQWLRTKASMTPINPSVVNFGPVPTVVQPTRGGAPVVTPLADPTRIATDTATVEERKQQAAEEGKATGQRAATFNSDLGRIDDEIERTERLLAEFRAGKYQTGPLAGRLPNVRTAAQELSREQGKDVIGAISSATFGALSEGEREFLRNLGVAETATEEANISLLEQRKRELTRARDRLRQQGLAGNYGNNAPDRQQAPQSTRVQSLLDKYAPK